MENKSQTLDQTFNKTDFGHFVATNKSLVIGLLVFFLVGALGYSFYRSNAEEAHEKSMNEIFTFSQTKLKDFQTKKISKDDVLAAYKGLDAKVMKSQGMFTLSTELAMALRDQGEAAAAVSILAPVLDNFSSSNYAYYFISANLAVLYEENNELDKAISSLENLTKAKVKVMEAKTYFDLGRLYKTKNDLSNARLNFNYVVSNFAQDDFAKLSKIYLMEMEAK
ncbi:MAG: tetratricopeptide repeat protein [Bacteriovoracaceae bacterium]